MRTTLRIDDELLKEAKRIALESDRTLTQVVEDALRESLACRKAAAGRKRTRVELPSFRGNGLQPGVTWEDLNSNSRMLDIIEGHDLRHRAEAGPGR